MSRKILKEYRKDLLPIIVNKEDYNLNLSSKNIIETICPICGSKNLRSVRNLCYSKRYVCKTCDDGVSIGEKFILNILKDCNIVFETEKIFHWSENKRYDFYLNDYNTIIECHGEQHYKIPRGVFRRTYCQKDRDNYKQKLANINGVDNYIIINGSISEFYFLKQSISKALYNIIDIETVKWDKLWEKSLKSNVVKTWSIWNDGNYDYKFISNELKIGESTVRRYIKYGIQCGKVNLYENKTMAKKVLQYSLKGEYIKTWKSAIEAENNTGVLSTNISACCLRKVLTAGGFLWCHENNKIDNVLLKIKNNIELKKIDEFSIDGIFVKTWNNATEIYEHDYKDKKISKENTTNVIVRGCREKIKTYGKVYRWHNDTKAKDIIVNIKTNKKPILQKDNKGNIIKRWESASEVYKEIKIDASSIHKCCKGKLKTVHGFLWCYE